MLYQVVAMANHRVIGKDNRLPWHFGSDLKFFKQLTMGQTIIMGRKTFESIGKLLPGRENFVLSRACHPERSEGSQDKLREESRRSFGPSDLRMTAAEPKFFDSIDKAFQAISTKHGFIIGGASIFKETMPLVDGIYMTRIHENFAGDTFYPEVPAFFKEEIKTLLQENPKLEVLFLRNQQKSKES